MAEAAAEGRIRSVVTPEGVDLKLRLAEASERAGAFLIDAVVIVLALAALTLVVALALTQADGVDEGGVYAIIWLLGAFLLRNAYFIFFEIGPRAATPGKRALGLRVASRDGGPLKAESVFARNALREIEVWLPLSFLLSQAESVDGWIMLLGLVWTGVFAFLPLFNKDRLRAGDLAGGTWVVKAPRATLLRDLSGDATAGFAFTPAQVQVYGVKELHVLEEVLRARDRRVMAAVADRIRGKIGWSAAPDESDQAFLAAYYAALRGRLEHRLLFGHRRRDKFDAA